MKICERCGAACEETDLSCGRCGAEVNGPLRTEERFAPPTSEETPMEEPQLRETESRPEPQAEAPFAATEEEPYEPDKKETGVPQPREGRKLFFGILCGVLILALLMTAVVIWDIFNKPAEDAAYLAYQTAEGDLYYVAPRSGKAVLLADSAAWDSTPHELVSPTGKSYAYFFEEALYVGRTDQAESAEKVADSVQDAFWGEDGDILQFIDGDGAYYVFKNGKTQRITSSVLYVGNTDGHHLYYMTPLGNLYVRDVSSLFGQDKRIAKDLQEITASGTGGLYYTTQKNEFYYLKEGGRPVLLDAKTDIGDITLISAQFSTGKVLYTDGEGNGVYAAPGAAPLHIEGEAENGCAADFDREMFFIMKGKDICRYGNGETLVLQGMNNITYSFDDGIAWCVEKDGELQAYVSDETEPITADAGVARTLKSKDSRCVYVKNGKNGECKLYLTELGKQPQFLESGKYGFSCELFEKGLVYAKYRDAEGKRAEIWVCPKDGEARQVYADACGYGFWNIDDLYYQDIEGALYWFNGKEPVLISKDCAAVNPAR